ncbi:MAG: GNAT family N-acetyltransferase [Endomicrobium sp.]|jgi:hypothetical protein|nr:GNAT family N-acetyltransferase [Endomicrobium sp.]
MKSTVLASLINKLNKNKTNGLIHLRSISHTVDFAKVLEKKPRPTDSFIIPDTYYFIKNSEGLYVAAVLDAHSDLYWYVSKKHRGQGYLTNSMRKVILKHIFQYREKQKISINKNELSEKNFKASQNVALSLGFTKTDDNSCDYVLSNDNYKTNDNIQGTKILFTEKRLSELKHQLNFLATSLCLIKSEIEVKLGYSDFTQNLDELVHMIAEQKDCLEDAQKWSRGR